MCLCLLLFGLTFALGGQAASNPADEWPQFRGPSGQGLSNAKNVPSVWSKSKNIRWRATIPGRGWSSPVISRERVYLTTAVSSDKSKSVSLRALCLSLSDGKIVWDSEVFAKTSSALGSIHEKNGLASPTPVVSADRLFVHFGHLGTAALDLEGKVLWRQTQLVYEPVHGNGGSPILVGNLLVFNCDGADNPAVVALDAANGDIRWITPRHTSSNKRFSFSTPLEIEWSGARQIISPGSGFVGSYDPRDGHELWRIRYGEGYSIVPRPVFAHGLIFVSSGFDHPAVIAARPENAGGDVNQSNIVWSSERGAPHSPSMLVFGDELYFVSDGGIATCVDAATGKSHWTKRLGGTFSASPVYADDKLYFQNEDGVGYVVRQGKTYELLSKNDIDEPTLASYAVTDGALLIRAQSHLLRVGS